MAKYGITIFAFVLMIIQCDARTKPDENEIQANGCSNYEGITPVPIIFAGTMYRLDDPHRYDPRIERVNLQQAYFHRFQNVVTIQFDYSFAMSNETTATEIDAPDIGLLPYDPESLLPLNVPLPSNDTQLFGMAYLNERANSMGPCRHNPCCQMYTLSCKVNPGSPLMAGQVYNGSTIIQYRI